MRVIIVDDEQPVRETFSLLIKGMEIGVEVVAEANSVSSGIELIREHQPDVVLLDIQMGDGDGFQLLDAFDEVDFEVIFVTAFHEHALRAFRYAALDYLMKPISGTELKESLLRAKKARGGVDKKQLSTFEDHMAAGRKTKPQKVVLRTAEAIHLTEIEKIIRCEAHSNYTTVFLKGGRKIVVSQTLKYYEELLTPHNFFRSHQSHLINMDCLDHFDRTEGGKLVMSDGSLVPVSKRKRDTLMTYLDGHI